MSKVEVKGGWQMKTVKKCVIPIAGYGTRLFPATKAIPKALFPIVDTDGIAKPIIQIIIEEVVASGIEEICLVTQSDQIGAVKNYFSKDVNEILGRKPDLQSQTANILELGRRITYVIQHGQEGFGHAVYCSREFVGNEPFLVLLSDHIYISTSQKTCTGQVIDVFQQYEKSATGVTETPEEQLKSFGTIQGKRVNESVYEVTILKEKPDIEFARRHLRIDELKEGVYLCNFGIDVLTPRIFDILEYNIRNNIRLRGEFQLRDAMETLIQKDGMYACLVKGERYDIGTPQEFVKTVANFGAHSQK